MTAGRNYRTNIEILGDLLGAVRKPVPKTRIMGAANLNPHSFQDYLRFCTEHDLVLLTPGGYVSTRRGDSVREAIEDLVAKTNELESVAHRFHRNVNDQLAPNGANGAALHFVSRWVWNEVVLNGRNGSRGRRSGGLALGGHGGLGNDGDPSGPRDRSQEDILDERARPIEKRDRAKEVVSRKGGRLSPSRARPGR